MLKNNIYTANKNITKSFDYIILSRKIKKLFVVILLFLSPNIFAAVTSYYSIVSGVLGTNSNWSNSSCGGASCGCNPGTTITSAKSVTICSGTIMTESTITIDGGTLLIKNGGELHLSSTITIKSGSHLTVEAGGVLKVDVFTNECNSVIIDGSLIIMGSGGKVFENKSGATITGSGTITIPNGTAVSNGGAIFGSGAAPCTNCVMSSAGNSGLPIELLSFSAKSNNNLVDLKWITASEKNNEYFTIERTKDGINYETIEKVKGAGNSSSVRNYSTTDLHPYEGISYYRLMQTDYNGEFTYSNLVSVDFRILNEFSFKVIPNPNEGESISLLLNATKGDEILVVVYDIAGRESYSKIILTEDNVEQVYAIDPSQKLPSGVYMIVATDNQKIVNKKLIVK